MRTWIAHKLIGQKDPRRKGFCGGELHAQIAAPPASEVLPRTMKIARAAEGILACV
jgi:hypothetical protein